MKGWRVKRVAFISCERYFNGHRQGDHGPVSAVSTCSAASVVVLWSIWQYPKWLKVVVVVMVVVLVSRKLMKYVFISYEICFLYKCQERLEGVHPRNLHVSSLPRSMASKKSKIPTNTTERVGGLISNNTSTSPSWLLKITLLF